MRLAYTSDIHVDAGAGNAALLPYLAARTTALAPDAFVLAGDVAETLAGVAGALAAFAALRCPKFYLPGNHDLFVEGAPAPGATSRDKYERLLPAVAAAAGFQYLGLDPHRVGDVVFCGVTGWYDYTFRDPTLAAVVSQSHYDGGRWRDIRAFDRGHVFWPRDAATAARTSAAATHAAQPASAAGVWASDRELEAWMRARLAAQLERVQPPARSIVAVVHVLPFAELVRRGAFGPVAFHDAWLGSAALGECLRRVPELRLVVCGHQHHIADVDIAGIRVVARPVGTLRDASVDLAEVARAGIGLVEIA